MRIILRGVRSLNRDDEIVYEMRSASANENTHDRDRVFNFGPRLLGLSQLSADPADDEIPGNAAVLYHRKLNADPAELCVKFGNGHVVVLATES